MGKRRNGEGARVQGAQARELGIRVRKGAELKWR